MNATSIYYYYSYSSPPPFSLNVQRAPTFATPYFHINRHAGSAATKTNKNILF
jgi:hypothetical protein